MFMAGADGTAFRVTTKNHSKSLLLVYHLSPGAWFNRFPYISKAKLHKNDSVTMLQLTRRLLSLSLVLHVEIEVRQLKKISWSSNNRPEWRVEKAILRTT